MEIPPGVYDIVLGREAYEGLPVPILPDRKKGDTWRLKENLKSRVGHIMAGVINSISRHHAIAQVREQVVTLRDAGSREGTKLNGDSLRGSDKRQLKNGDKILLSAWELEYYCDPKDCERILAKKPGAFRLATDRLGADA